jgi:hypothetical protein
MHNVYVMLVTLEWKFYPLLQCNIMLNARLIYVLFFWFYVKEHAIQCMHVFHILKKFHSRGNVWGIS